MWRYSRLSASPRSAPTGLCVCRRLWCRDLPMRWFVISRLCWRRYISRISCSIPPRLPVFIWKAANSPRCMTSIRILAVSRSISSRPGLRSPSASCIARQFHVPHRICRSADARCYCPRRAWCHGRSGPCKRRSSGLVQPAAGPLRKGFREIQSRCFRSLTRKCRP